RLALAAAESLRRGGGWLDLVVTQPDSARTFVATLEAEALRDARDPSASVARRQAAIRLLSCESFSKVREVFTSLLDVREPVEIQSSVIKALGGYHEPEVAEIVLSHWKTSTPDLRSQALDTLLNREDRTATFLHAVEDGRVAAAQIDAAWRMRLLAHRNEAIRKEAQRLLGGQVAARRQQVVDGFRPALKLAGIADRGKSVFTRECSACHRIGETGQAVGPDLTSSSARDPETLLVHILDPNRDVLPNFVQYQLADVDGRIYSGLIASQSASSVTLKTEGGKTETIPRGRVDQMTSSGISLMPEGFELKIDRQEMADLLAFLQDAQPGSRATEPPLEIGTEPGLAEPDPPPR
ncbi:c-type cytochrome, partial [Singulisphaera rosea]